MSNTNFHDGKDFFRPTQDGHGWQLSNEYTDGTRLEVMANDVPIAIIPLDIYDEGDFGQLEQAKANAQLIVNAHNLFDVVKLSEQALSNGDPEQQAQALEALRGVIARCNTYTGPEISIPEHKIKVNNKP